MNTNAIILAGVFLYLCFDILRHYSIFRNRKILILSIVDGLFIFTMISILITDLLPVNTFMWLIIPFWGLLSLYYQYLKFRKSAEPLSIRILRIGVVYFLFVVLLIKI